MGQYIKETIKNSLKNKFSAQMLTKNLHAVERFNKETTFKDLPGDGVGVEEPQWIDHLNLKKKKKKTF